MSSDEFDPLDQTHPALGFLGVVVCFSDVYKESPTIALLKEKLNKYSLWQVVDFISRTGILIANAGPRDLDLQAKLCSIFFGPVKFNPVWDTVKSQRTKHPNAGHIEVFSEIQLINALKFAFLLLPVESPDNESGDLSDLGDALLIINDLVFSAELLDEGFTEHAITYFVSRGYWSSGGREMHDFARAHELYLSDIEDLANSANYMPLKSVFQEKVGLHSTAVSSVLFSLFGEWKGKSEESIVKGAPFLNRRNYFADFDFLESEENKFFDFVCRDVTWIKEEVLRLYSEDNFQPFNALPFAKYPLIQFSNSAIFCSNLKLFSKKIARGFHHVFLDETLLTKKERQRYLNFTGELFEYYASQALERLFGSEPNCLVYPEKHRKLNKDWKRQGHEEKCADAALVIGRSMIIFEFKGALLSIEAILGKDFPSIERYLEKTTFLAATQIDSTIGYIESGGLRDMGIHPEDIERYFPIVLTLEQSLMEPFFVQHLATKLREKSVLQNPKAHLLQQMSIGEFDNVETGSSAGLSLEKLLVKKLSRKETSELSFNHYWHFFEPDWVNENNPHLLDVFQKLANRNKDFLSSRRRPTN